MSTLQANDLFLVNRSNATYSKEAQGLFDDIQNNDLLLVNRDSQSYKLTGNDFKESILRQPTFRSATLTEEEPTGDRYTSEAFTIDSDLDLGIPAAQLSIKVVLAAELYDPNTDAITSTELFAVLNSDLKVIDLQATDPGFTKVHGICQKISFPRILPNSKTPDEVLLPSITIKTIVKAVNTVNQDITIESNTLIPNQLAQLNANSSADVATYNTISAVLQGYEADRDAFRQSLRSTMLSNNFTEAEISSINL